MVYIVLGIILLTLLILFTLVTILTDNIDNIDNINNIKPINLEKQFEISDIKENRFGFKFVNTSPHELDIYLETNEKEPLILITRLNSLSTKFIYPQTQKILPGMKLYAKLPEDDMGTFMYKPYELYYLDYEIIFGAILTDTMRTLETTSTRYEILSLYIENRSLKPYKVWYNKDYLGLLEPYFPGKNKLEYSLYTTNKDKHFQLGGKLYFETGGKVQSIILQDRNTTDVYVGDVIAYEDK